MVKCSWGGTMTLQESFENIKDERIDRCKKHNLVDILMIVFMGLLCGYKSIEGITSAATIRLPKLTDEFAFRQTSQIIGTLSRTNSASSKMYILFGC